MTCKHRCPQHCPRRLCAECGTGVGPYKHFCDECMAVRRRKQNRANHRMWRRRHLEAPPEGPLR